jgi:signal transduction histidine kinase
VRDLRTLLVELNPARLQAVGLVEALSDLVSPLQSADVSVEVEVPEAIRLAFDQEALVFRVAQEAVRNVALHAGARSVRVQVTEADGVARLVVADDGRGFSPEERSRRAGEGHLGLSLTEELVAQAGGSMAIHSLPGEGTRVEAEVPAA